MSNFWKIFLGAIAILAISGCAPSQADLAQIKTDCSTKGGNFIFHEGECLQTEVVKGKKQGVINVLLHGQPGLDSNIDLSSSQAFATELTEKTGYSTFYYARPNYGQSSNNVWKRQPKVNNTVNEKYIRFNADFIKKLMQKANATKANLIGFSAGTTVALNIAEADHTITDKVVLLAGGYDVYKQEVTSAEAMGGCAECKKKNIRQSLAGGMIPIDSVEKLDPNIKLLLVAGDKDKIAPTELSEDYIKELEKNNISYKYVIHKQEGTFYNPMNAHKNIQFEPTIWKLAAEFING